MNTTIKQIEMNGLQYKYHHVDECPHCGVPQRTEVVKYAMLELTNASKIFIVTFSCMIHDCGKRFFTCNISDRHTRSGGPAVWEPTLLLIYPSPHAGQELKRIEAISPEAARIYSQAMEAKIRGLHELVGMGIRKSLEHLLHDFGTRYYPDQSEFNNNPKTTFAQRIDRFIESAVVKELATACARLGNDCTHPIRRHTEKDVSDLERFAKALFYHINMVYEARNALDELNQSTSE